MAHPDDETLWAGGLPLRFPFPWWTIIACSIPRFDPIRAHHFFAACETLGARGVLLPYTESDPSMALGHLEELNLSPYSCLVTHGAAGEYGHVHHQQLHQVILAQRHGRPVIAFGFRTGSTVLELTAKEAAGKRRALACYCGPSAGSSLPKGEHLLERYCRDGFTLERETYDCLGLSD